MRDIVRCPGCGMPLPVHEKEDPDKIVEYHAATCAMVQTRPDCAPLRLRLKNKK